MVERKVVKEVGNKVVEMPKREHFLRQITK
jgi:hypothetical protein